MTNIRPSLEILEGRALPATVQPVLVVDVAGDGAINYGDTLSFLVTGVPREAFSRSRQNQYPDNPVTELVVSQGGAIVQMSFSGYVDRTKDRDGTWTLETGPIVLGAPSNGYVWPGGDAVATVFEYWVRQQRGDVQFNVLAQETFEVLA